MMIICPIQYSLLVCFCEKKKPQMKCFCFFVSELSAKTFDIEAAYDTRHVFIV